jgi:HD-GYP domain-containing protein (c-di-GMP phosphodiesterase class II)
MAIYSQHASAAQAQVAKKTFYSVARQIARSHHEWMDGSGYPDGLGGVKIPLVARIVAVADVYALTHTRPYKKAWPRYKAIEEINRLAGRQFDTDIVDAFVEIFSEGPKEAMET